jgi:DNA-directed RNA polymerase subunit H
MATYQYTPWLIYKNLAKFIEHRGLTGADYKANMDKNALLGALNSQEYIKIEAKKGQMAVIILLIAEDSEYMNKTQKFVKLLSNIGIDEDNTEKINLVAITPTGCSKNILKKTEEYHGLYFEDVKYYNMIIVIPEHPIVPKHEIMAPNEAKELMEVYYLDKKKIPRINSDDSAIIWLGAEPGNIIRIYKISDTCGESIYYRIVTKRVI